MIKFVREYTTEYSDEKYWDVIHETNGNERLYFYCESGGGIPKTVQRFINESEMIIPYDNKVFKEKGVVYW